MLNAVWGYNHCLAEYHTKHTSTLCRYHDFFYVTAVHNVQ